MRRTWRDVRAAPMMSGIQDGLGLVWREMRRWFQQASTRIVTKPANSELCPRPLRSLLLNISGFMVAPTAQISPGQFYGDRKRLSVGARSRINRACYFDLSAEVTIGIDVGIGPQCMILTATHDIGATSRRESGYSRTLPVEIEDGCWIGARVLILPGVTIRRGCVIAAGSVVTKSTDADTLYAGVPARAVRPLP